MKIIGFAYETIVVVGHAMWKYFIDQIQNRIMKIIQTFGKSVFN